ncbi:MAG: hypothetical protein MRZ45_00590 [Blautia sp.]|nr:hypothetical protein [Blautia sp.]MDY4514956.1 hypothetical protein [Lachnospiraceae bacterium]
MLNLPLLKRTVKAGGKKWLIFTGLLTLQLLLVLGIYKTGTGTQRGFMSGGMSEKVAAVFGIGAETDTLTEYLCFHLYRFFIPVLSMIYACLTANQLMAQKVESKEMVYLLTTPNKRRCIANTQAYFLIMSLFLMFFYITILGIICCAFCFPGKFEIVPFVLLNIGGFCLLLCLSGISFLASCISDECRISLLTGTGICILFLLLRMMANIGGVLELLKFTTVFTLFDIEGILEGNLNICWQFPLLAVSGFLFYRAGIRLFEKRDLPV